MKQLIVICAMLLITGSLHADEYDDFRQLPVEEKVRVYLEKFRYKPYEYSPFIIVTPFPADVELSRYTQILIDEYPKIIPVLLDRLEMAEMTPMPPLEGRDGRTYPVGWDRLFEIIDELIIRYIHFSINLFNQEERARLVSIYRQKIHEYLTTYKVVDLRIVSAAATIARIEQIERIERIGILQLTKYSSSDIARGLYKKYTDQGYKDLRLDLTHL